MTDRELMQQALEALEQIAAYRPLTFAECSDAEAVMGIAERAIPALRERLAHPEPGCAECGKSGGWALYCVECMEKVAQPEQEPVAWMDEFGNVFPLGAQRGPKHLNELMKPLYTTPQRREWVGLSEAEQEALWDEAVDRQEHFCSQYGDFADAIEAKLREKNT